MHQIAAALCFCPWNLNTRDKRQPVRQSEIAISKEGSDSAPREDHAKQLSCNINASIMAGKVEKWYEDCSSDCYRYHDDRHCDGLSL